MAEKDNIYGGFGDIYGGIGKVLPFLTDTLPKYGVASGTNILGGGTDVLGILAENIGQDNLARLLRSNAQDLYDLGGEFLRGGNIFETAERLDREKRLNTFERSLAESKLVDPDRMKSFEPPEPESDLGKRLSEIDSLLSSASPRVPPEGRPPTPTEEKASAEESLLKEAQQSAQAEEQLFGKEKEDFRAKEEARLQGTPPTPENKEKIQEDAFKMIMEENLRAAGKGKNVKGSGGARDLDFYKKEFAKATGVDISGKPDKSNFLMALGLGLMQNRAGKGFNVGKILGAVGESAQKAMPKLIEAQKEAKANMVAAGKYALQSQAKDRATAASASKKLSEEKGYFIVPTGGKAGLTPSEYLANADNGKYMKLSNAQLAQLEANPEFNKNYSILPGDMWGDIVKETIESQGKKGVEYLKKTSTVQMFPGADDDYFSFEIQRVDQNTVPAGEYAPPRYNGEKNTDLAKLNQIKIDGDKSERTFKEIAKLLNQTDIAIPDQLRSMAIQTFRNLGFKTDKSITDPVKQIDYLLTKLKAENASAILQEAGKTLSDKDREMVAQIVGEISFTEGDEDQLVRKLGRLYGKIVGAKRRNLQIAAETFYNFGLTEASKYFDETNEYASFIQTPTLGDVQSTRFVLGDDGIYSLVNIE